MNNLSTNTGHIIIAVVAIASATVLGVQHVITPGEVIGLIAGAGGFSMGASAASIPTVPVAALKVATP
jgi:hypothetical protein